MATSPNPDASEQLLAIGKQCHHASCHLVDFLPFRCQHCKESFCQEHFLVDQHECPSYDESKHNRVAPNCPLCNQPVAIPPGQDPNRKMDEHLNRDCSVMTGKAPKKSVPTCNRGKCGKALYAPITCNGCRKQFCPTHRFPQDHSCASASAPNLGGQKPATSKSYTPSLPSSSQQQRSGNLTAGSRLLALNNKAGAAIKKGVTSASTAVSKPNATPSSSSASSNTNSIPNPFSKTDRASNIQSTITNLTKPNSTSPTTPIIAKPKSPIFNSYAPPPIFGAA